jgi:signal transduction histidine kinase
VIRFNMPKLRIYQQILLGFALIVTLPLLGVSLLIHNINQQALKKELGRFTEHTAEALYKDFGTEMAWQKQQTRTMAQLMAQDLRDGRGFDAAARRIIALNAEIDGVGLYDKDGHAIHQAYRDFKDLSPELRLPDELTAENNTFLPFQVIYFNAGNPQESPYCLRAVFPLPGGYRQQPAYYVQQKRFSYLQNLVRSDNSLYDAFYIIDNDGAIIAGPVGMERQARISPSDYAEFVKIEPGVTHVFSSTSQASQAQPPKRKDGDELPTLKKVIVKMPEINWGIIIESPYHLKQKYIKRAGTHTLLLILGCLGVILLIVIPYVWGISRNFRQLIKGIQAMGEGNYFRRIRLITHAFTPYEIVYLTLEFNRMARKTADSWQAIQAANRKLAQMDEFKSNLIDTVSHELRTPLTSIKGYTSRLLRYDNALDAETRIKSLKIIKQQADRLSRLVDDLLVIPDLEKATLRVYPDRVELAPLLENCVQFIQAKEHREILVSFLSREAEASPVLADPDRLEQIVLNLLDNAVKYSPAETPIEVFVEKTDQTDGPGYAVFTIQNACDPIPVSQLEELDALFDKFKRLDDSLVRTTRGSGLGLFITRELVSVMGGTIRLAYEDGVFKVCFTIPLYQEAPVAV